MAFSASGAGDGASILPWIVSDKRKIAPKDLSKLFGKCEPIEHFIDNMCEDGYVSLSIDKWPIPDENGNLKFHVCIQEERGGFHGVCFANIIVDSNYRFVSETIHDKYNDGFEIGWDGIYTFVRFLAGCSDWHNPIAAGVIEHFPPNDAALY